MLRRVRFWTFVLAWAPGTVLAQAADTSATLRLIAVGDVNLGRSLGQRILRGETDYPFHALRDWFSGADAVFANLESPISDQHGETESPRSNVVFCAPPVAADVLRAAGISVVSTANNHAADYGATGIAETIAFLHQAGVQPVGTTVDAAGTFAPAILDRHGIRVAIVAFTQFVNGRAAWEQSISLFDSSGVRRQIDSVRSHADVVIASFHGGREYASDADTVTEQQMRYLIDAGADIVLAHHPHVAWGVEEYRGHLIFRSLGNCVFYQPQRRWADVGLAAELVWTRRDGRVVLRSARFQPLRTGFQPTRDVSPQRQRALFERLRRRSTVPLIQEQSAYAVDLHGIHS